MKYLTDLYSEFLCREGNNSPYGFPDPLGMREIYNVVYCRDVNVLKGHFYNLVMACSKLQSRLSALLAYTAYQTVIINRHINPVWLVDSHRVVLFANKQAKLYQTEHASLWFQNNGVLNIDTDINRFSHIIARATATDDAPRPGICYTRHDPTKAIFVMPVITLPAVAMITICLPRPEMSTLSDLFATTPHENALAGLLVQGMTAHECACALNVSITTIRTHLRALFRKTGTRNQTELVLILLLVLG